jgi:very-short-patch-repair endonuclease
MTDKNRTGYWIKRKGNTKLVDTAPERAFEAFCKFKGYRITRGEPVLVDGWRLTPDFDMELGKQVQIVILIDGRYHWTDTQAKKDQWRDGLYQKAGKRVVHIDAPLTDKRYWDYLGTEFVKAITHGPVTYIHQ